MSSLRWSAPLALLVVACDPVEGRQAVSVPFELEPLAVDRVVVEGTPVHVDHLALQLGAVALRGEDPTDTASAIEGYGLWDWVVPAAVAHPGHGGHGVVVAEWVGPTTVELTGRVEVGRLEGWSGQAQTIDVRLEEAAVSIRGAVGEGEGARPFDLTAWGPLDVLGIPCPVDFTESRDQPLRLRVNLSEVLQRVPWDLDDAVREEALGQAIASVTSWSMLEP